MTLLSIVNMLSGQWLQILLSSVCVFLLYKIVKYFTGEVRRLPVNTNRRRLGHLEDMTDIMSMEKNGSGNICLMISLKSKQSLVHQHVRDALMLLAKRQPMLRAIITMADGDKYFEIKEISEVVALLDITTSQVKASDWQDVWFQYTAKLRGNGLLWRVMILQEEFAPDTEDYVNTLMFNFNHACTDGVSSVKFCKQFLNNMNELANGTSYVDQEITSLEMLPPLHHMVTRGRIWHTLFNFVMPYCGLRPILKYVAMKLTDRLLEKKPNNPYHEKFPPNKDDAIPCRLNIKVFTESETKVIIQACKQNNCTVTGAITAVAHLAFCELVEDSNLNDVDLECSFAINAKPLCNPKPDEDYIGFLVYIFQNFNMKYRKSTSVDFWKLAKETTGRMKESVKKEAFVSEVTMLCGIMSPREICELLINDRLFEKSVCNFVSSFGSFNFGEEQSDTYKLHDCFINTVTHVSHVTFFHFIHTINGKMAWQITSSLAVHGNHAENFAGLCFNKLREMTLCEI